MYDIGNWPNGVGPIPISREEIMAAGDSVVVPDIGGPVM